MSEGLIKYVDEFLWGVENEQGEKELKYGTSLPNNHWKPMLGLFMQMVKLSSETQEEEMKELDMYEQALGMTALMTIHLDRPEELEEVLIEGEKHGLKIVDWGGSEFMEKYTKHFESKSKEEVVE